MERFRYTISFLLCLLTLSLAAQTINKAEYFFDSDPGLGNGIDLPLSITGDSVWITNGTIPFSNLSLGTHQLYVRVRDANDSWSGVENHLILITTIPTGSSPVATTINKAEYFFDSDPGVGNGIDLPLSMVGDSVWITNGTIPFSNMSLGPHQLYVRVRDVNDAWSGVENHLILITTIPTGSSPVATTINKAEYFFDSDPGVGNGIDLPLSMVGDSVWITNGTIPFTNMSLGTHQLYVRVRDVNDSWSGVENHLILITTIPTGSSPVATIINKAEYFFDSDPGVGNGIDLPLGMVGDSVWITNGTIPFSNLSLGSHQLYVRVRDVNDAWSLTEVGQLTISNVMTLTWTGNTSSSWAVASNWSPNFVPTIIDNVIIPTTTNKPVLPTNQTVNSVTLSGTNKVMLGNYDLNLTTLTGGNSTTYFVTDGIGKLKLPVAAGTTQLFPVGPSTTSYDPVTVKPTNSTTFATKVKALTVAGEFSGPVTDITRVAFREWDISPTDNAGATVLSLTTNASVAILTTPKVGHFRSTNIWEELPTTYAAQTWTATTTSFSPFGVGSAGGFATVVSVELIDFKGKHTEGGNLLTWQTATEINNKGFQVERSPQPSKGASTAWDILGFVNAQGKAATYTFTDINPLPTSYYRLRQIDNDGKEELTKVISISTKIPHPLKIYPNVVKDFLTVETDNTDDFVIVNLLGQQVLRGKTAQRIDVSALPQGAYLLRIGSEVAKFVKE